GVRDFPVTGVQTCALPIAPRAPAAAGRLPPQLSSRRQAGAQLRGGGHRPALPYGPDAPPSDAHPPAVSAAAPVQPGGASARAARSEERRVGEAQTLPEAA